MCRAGPSLSLSSSTCRIASRFSRNISPGPPRFFFAQSSQFFRLRRHPNPLNLHLSWIRQQRRRRRIPDTVHCDEGDPPSLPFPFQTTSKPRTPCFLEGAHTRRLAPPLPLCLMCECVRLRSIKRSSLLLPEHVRSSSSSRRRRRTTDVAEQEEEEKELRRPPSPSPLPCCSCRRAEGKVTRKLPSSPALPLPYLYSGGAGWFCSKRFKWKKGKGEEGRGT